MWYKPNDILQSRKALDIPVSFFFINIIYERSTSKSPLAEGQKGGMSTK